MPSYHIFRSRAGGSMRLEIGEYSFGFSPSEWSLFAATVQSSLPGPMVEDEGEDEDEVGDGVGEEDL